MTPIIIIFLIISIIALVFNNLEKDSSIKELNKIITRLHIREISYRTAQSATNIGNALKSVGKG